MSVTINHPIQADIRWFLQQSRPRRLRSMKQFAEQEIVIPSGPFEGRRFRCTRQPYTSLWFDAVDSGMWTRHVATGPTQSGKTLSCFVVPLLYHLFEIEETVICGLPDMDMAADKWREDILPVIEQSRYRDLLPSQGAGSRGGLVDYIQFKNGAPLKFMSGGGNDKSRAAFTSRVLVITETDGMDTPGLTSRESDKITQMEARTRAFGQRRRIYMECTVSTENGRTWQNYSKGTRSRIALQCPQCRQWVTPEREHLTGWQGSENQSAARKSASFACPGCGECWSNEQRTLANSRSILLHEGQSVEGLETPTVVGELPPTDTLGFRWSAVNNLFLTAGDIAADEWRASRAVDEDSAERELRQFVWCIPVVPVKLAQTALEVHELAARMTDTAKGIVPANMPILTAGVDLGKYLAHWVIVAWTAEATGHIVDYGRFEVASDSLGVEQGIMVALREMKDFMLAGWPQAAVDGERLLPTQVFVDAGYMTDVVYSFCREAGDRFRPTFGRGAGQQYKQQWAERTTQTGSTVKLVGDGCHVAWLPVQQLHIIEADADHWKTWVHQRLSTPIGSAGAMTLYRASPQDHMSLAKHLTAEVKTEEFVAGKGVVTKWERIRRQNHWLDALYNSCVAAHGCGVRLVREIVPVRPEPPPEPPDDRDGSSWIDRGDVRDWLHRHKGRW